MERHVARNFIQTVKKLIPKDEEEHIFVALRQYQSSLDLPKFVEDLKAVINEPAKICIFDEIRPLVHLNQQIAYDYLCPIIPSATKKVIHLQNTENGRLGFSLRGGAEHGIGLYVSKISPSSEAYKKDMRCGDEVVSINGFHIVEAIHAEIIDLINDLQEIELNITRIGMIPYRFKASDVVRWKYVPKEEIISSSSKYPVKIFINMSTTGGLGCRIVSGPPNQTGIFVQSVKSNSLAEEAGLETGDHILSVNEISFLDATHSQAVMALKTSQHLLMRVRKRIAASWIDNLKISASQKSQPYLGLPTQSNRSISPDYSDEIINKTSTLNFSEESESSNVGRSFGEIDVQIINGFNDDDQSPYKPDYDSGPYLPEPPRDFLTDTDTNDNNPISSNFVLYKNPELSVSNENVAALSENEARKLFTSKEIGGRQIREIQIRIKGILGMSLEGGANSPLEGRILVSNIYTGCIHKQGGIHVGDEILMADNIKFVGLTLVQAENNLDRVERKLNQTVKFIIAVARPKNYDEEMTYF